jgi:hypothetical protein
MIGKGTRILPANVNLLSKFINSLQERGLLATSRRVAAWLREQRRQLVLRLTVLRDRDPGVVFTRIYRTGYWGSAESVSGPGSTLDFTANLRAELPQLMKTLNVRRVLDAPCGDFNWAQHVFPASGVDYIGGEIVAPLVERNQQQFGAVAIRFIVCDITKGPLPDADLWICRDCLFHLSYELIFKALRNFADSNIPYLLTTTHVRGAGITNRDIRTGDFRLIDLFAEPFNLPCEPVAMIDDSHDGDERKLVAWSRDQVSSALRTTSRPESGRG